MNGSIHYREVTKNPFSIGQESSVSLSCHLPLLPSGPDGVGRKTIAQSLTIITEGERRERDSNPRYPVRVHTLSKRTPSASRSSLQTAEKRRERDSNPRYRRTVQRISSPPDSTTLASLQFRLSSEVVCSRTQEDSNLRPLDPQSNALSN